MKLSFVWKVIIFGGVCSVAFFALSYLFDIFSILAIGSIVITVLTLLGLLFKKLFLSDSDNNSGN